jgi:integrase
MLVSTNKIEDLQLYCIILVFIHLFLRHDEISNIKVEDIQQDLSILKEGAVAALAIRVCGKTDKIWRTLVLWRKEDVPEFCPSRHLLAYVHLAKIQTRYLFANLRKKQEKQEYNGLLKLLKDRFGTILDREFKTLLLIHSERPGFFFQVGVGLIWILI